ncbi:MAG: FliH/SctL family protein [Thalassovita sp.]|nr:FliH/SctL family protein [Thalassovita sp.]
MTGDTMGYHSDIPVRKLNLDALSSLVRSSRDTGFQPRAFAHIQPGPMDGSSLQPQQDAPSDVPAPDLEEVRAKAHKTGFTEGFAQGYQQAKAEAAAAPEPAPEALSDPVLDASVGQMEEARAVFMELSRALVDHTEAHHTTLRQAMERTLIALASDLAGSRIDALPETYAAKIGDLVERIGHAVESTVVSLNPEDLEAITPCLDNNDVLTDCTLQPDARLARGAVDIKSGPNRVHTVLAETDPAEDDPE